MVQRGEFSPRFSPRFTVEIGLFRPRGCSEHPAAFRCRKAPVSASRVRWRIWTIASRDPTIAQDSLRTGEARVVAATYRLTDGDSYGQEAETGRLGSW